MRSRLESSNKSASSQGLRRHCRPPRPSARPLPPRTHLTETCLWVFSIIIKWQMTLRGAETLKWNVFFKAAGGKDPASVSQGWGNSDVKVETRPHKRTHLGFLSESKFIFLWWVTSASLESSTSPCSFFGFSLFVFWSVRLPPESLLCYGLPSFLIMMKAQQEKWQVMNEKKIFVSTISFNHPKLLLVGDDVPVRKNLLGKDPISFRILCHTVIQ